VEATYRSEPQLSCCWVFRMSLRASSTTQQEHLHILGYLFEAQTNAIDIWGGCCLRSLVDLAAKAADTRLLPEQWFHPRVCRNFYACSSEKWAASLLTPRRA